MFSNLDKPSSSNCMDHVNGTGHSFYGKRRLQIARKSLAVNHPVTLQLINSAVNSNSNGGQSFPRFCMDSIQTFQITRRPNILIETKTFTPHICGPLCIPITVIDHQSSIFSEEIPYAIPIILGWQRQTVIAKMKIEQNKQSVSAKEIIYVGPCGRRLRTIGELDEYLAMTRCPISVDYFTFEPYVSLFSESSATPLRCNWLENDITNGREMKKISAVNTCDNAQFPPDFCYIPNRYEGRSVDIPLDPSFLIRCDCTDGCRNRSACACQRLTIEATQSLPGRRKDLSAGYSYQRLKKFLVTGVYECNPYCSCNETCRNKVVQNGIKVRLQIFKTVSRGWGVRSLHDIPAGTFICTYAGEVMTEHEANRNATVFGDEYLADLDFIDVCETAKENYEDAPLEEISSDENSDDDDDDIYEVDDHESDESFSSVQVKSKRKNKSHSNNQNNKKSNGTNQPAGGNNCVNSNSNGKSYKYDSSSNQSDSLIKYKSIRTMFEENFGYTLDAARYGNVGRFLNHSCSPNCFAQSVFVDTHDLRFPWVAFFADKFIPAFSELTWDYNYEIGSVEGKMIRCFCNSNECRYRLL